MTEPTPESSPEPGIDLDVAKLALAVKAVISHGRPGEDGRRVPLKLNEVARGTGVGNSELSQLLNHRKPLSARDQYRVMRWLNLPPEYLTFETAPATPACAAA